MPAIHLESHPVTDQTVNPIEELFASGNRGNLSLSETEAAELRRIVKNPQPATEALGEAVNTAPPKVMAIR